MFLFLLYCLHIHQNLNNMFDTVECANNESITTTSTTGTYNLGYGYATPDSEIEEILEEVYKLGFENGGSAMKRLVNGVEKDETTKVVFERLGARIMNLLRNAAYPRTLPNTGKDPYLDNWTITTDTLPVTTWGSTSNAGGSHNLSRSVEIKDAEI